MRVQLSVLDVAGRECAVLVDAVQAAGRHVLQWDGGRASRARLADGVYFLRIRTAAGVESRKFVVVARR